jgi:hypothetical protein
MMNENDSINKWSTFTKQIQKNDPFFLIHSNKFNLTKNSKVFTIGSCFARNIEEVLENDFQFPITEYLGNKFEYQARRTRGILNKFTPGSIFHELDWLSSILNNGNFEEITKDYFCFELNDELCIDLGLQNFVPVTFNRFYERRKEILNIYSQIKDSESIIITFGLIEEWRYKDKPIQHAFNRKEMIKKGKNELSFSILTNDDTEKIINQIVNKIFSINKKIKIILTVSPVPLDTTFSNKHIIVANSLSKSTLRSSLNLIINKKNIDYFPSYEMINCYGPNAFEADLRHVKNEVVNNIFLLFKKIYL